MQHTPFLFLNYKMKKHFIILCLLICFCLTTVSSSTYTSTFYTPIYYTSYPVTYDNITQTIQDHNGLKYQITNSGFIKLTNLQNKTKYFGFAINGTYNSNPIRKTVEDFNFTKNINNDFEKINVTLDNGGSWKINLIFNKNGEDMKIIHTVKNIYPQAITNAKLWYIFTVDETDKAIYNGTEYYLSNISKQKSGNFNNVLAKIDFINDFDFEYDDLIRNNFSITNIYIGNGSVIGYPKYNILSLGFTKGSGILPSGASFIADPTLQYSNLTSTTSKGYLTNNTNVTSGNVQLINYSQNGTHADLIDLGLYNQYSWLFNWKWQDKGIDTPVANWHFDNETQFLDSSGYGNHGTPSGGAYINTTSYKFGSGAGSFDGVDDYISIPSSSNLITGTNPFTVEGWVYIPTSYTGSVIINLLTNHQMSDNLQFTIIRNTSKMEIWNVGYVLQNSIPSLTFDAWHHYAYTRNGNTWRTYWDGVQFGTDVTDSRSLGTPSVNYRIGVDVSGMGQWGQFSCDEVAIYNYTLSEATILAHNNSNRPEDYLRTKSNVSVRLKYSNDSTSSLLNSSSNGSVVSLWKMDGNWNDSTGRNNGTPSGATFNTTDYKFGTAAGSFDGNDYVSVPDSESWNFGTNDFSIEFWEKTSSNDKVIISYCDDNGNNGWYVIITTNIMAFRTQNSANYLFATSVPNNNAWQHWVFTKTGTTWKWYKDGALETPSSSATTATVQDHTGNLVIAGTAGGSYLVGNLDEVAIYNTTLSADEIKNHYQATYLQYSDFSDYYYNGNTSLPATTPARYVLPEFYLSTTNTSYTPTLYYYSLFYNETQGSAAPSNNKPNITLNSPANGYTTINNWVLFNYTYYDADNENGTVRLYINNVLNTTNSNVQNGTTLTTNLSFTSYNINRTWYVNATDGTDFNISATRWFIANYDVISPQINITYPLNNSIETAAHVLAVNATIIDESNMDLCQLNWNGTIYNMSTTSVLNNISYANYSFSVSSEGTFYFNVTCNDTAGNTNTSLTYVHIHDYTAPTLIFNEPTTNETLGYLTNWTFINVSITDAYPNVCLLEWNGVNESISRTGSICSINKSVPMTTANYTFKVYANDTVGYWNFTNTLKVSFDFTPPPAISSLSSPSQSQTWVYLTWTNPTTTDWNKTIIYKDGVNTANTTNAFYNNTGLTQGITYDYDFQTIDHVGNRNTTNVSISVSTVSQYLTDDEHAWISSILTIVTNMNTSLNNLENGINNNFTTLWNYWNCNYSNNAVCNYLNQINLTTYNSNITIDNISSILNNISTWDDIYFVNWNNNILNLNTSFRIELSDFDSITGGSKYQAKLNVFDYKGSPANLSEIPKINIYDPQLNLIVDNVNMIYSSSGYYTYNYTTASTSVSGVYETIVTSNYSNNIVYKNDYWSISSSPADVILINITDKSIPTIIALGNITNMGSAGSDFYYTWCIVNSTTNNCGGNDDLDYQSATRWINAKESWVASFGLETNVIGLLYFKLYARAKGDPDWAVSTLPFHSYEEQSYDAHVASFEKSCRMNSDCSLGYNCDENQNFCTRMRCENNKILDNSGHQCIDKPIDFELIIKRNMVKVFSLTSLFFLFVILCLYLYYRREK